jgi:IS30 family transposase
MGGHTLQWSPEKIASKIPKSHETICQKIYTQKEIGCHLWRSLRCQKQKRKR